MSMKRWHAPISLEAEIRLIPYKNVFYRFLSYKIRVFEALKKRETNVDCILGDKEIAGFIHWAIRVYNDSHLAHDPLYGNNQTTFDEVLAALSHASNFDEQTIVSEIGGIKK